MGPFTTWENVSAKLNFAPANLDMGVEDAATSIIAEILDEGSDAQKNDARELMRQVRK